MMYFKTVSPLIVVLMTSVIRVSVAEDSSFAIDINDILNVDLMPFSLLLVQGPKNNTNNTSFDDILMRESRDGLDGIDLLHEDNGSLDKAFHTMGYHRKMINEYLCSNFLADQILSEVVTPKVDGFQRRSGTMESEISTGRGFLPKSEPKEIMRFDQGSSGYKNWLSKTTSLEDIYRHVTGHTLLPTSPTPVHSVPRDRPKGFEPRKDFSSFINYEDEYDEGEVTGYAHMKPIDEHNLSDIPNPQPTAGSKFSGYPSHFPPEYESSISHTPHYESGGHAPHYEFPPEKHHSKDKSLKLKDLFDIALTTLAFLSFGLFILHLLLCLSAAKSNASMVMMPINPGTGGGTATGGGTGDGAEQLGRSERVRRSLEITFANKQIDDVAKMVLRSIDAVTVAQLDEGKCLQRTLCEFNKKARGRKDSQKMWMPVWTLGMSWLSSRMVKPTVSMPILESLRAAAIGLGNGNCRQYFSECRLTGPYNATKGN